MKNLQNSQWQSLLMYWTEIMKQQKNLISALKSLMTLRIEK